MTAKTSKRSGATAATPNTAPAKRPPGRPSSYSSSFLPQVTVLGRLGATDAELADAFEVSTVTIWDWKAKHPDFVKALKPAKDEADDRVERSLYQRAVGYSFDSVKVFCSKDGDITEHPIRVHVPPDVTACIFWLKNRRTLEWRDRHQVDHNVSGEVRVIEQTMSPREAAEAYAMTLKAVPQPSSQGGAGAGSEG